MGISANNTNTYSSTYLSLGRESDETKAKADSIMQLVIQKAVLYKNTISRYETDIYIKGHTEILKQNVLIRLAHHIFPVDRKNKNMVFEMLSHSQYHAPKAICMI